MLVALGLFTRGLIKREQERSDNLQSEVNRLNALMQDKTIPSLLAATQAVTESQKLIERMARLLDLSE